MIDRTWAPEWADPVVRRLSAAYRLEQADLEAVVGRLQAPTEHRAWSDLGDDGDGTCRFLVSGWACRVRQTPWGSRQILDVLLPGDPVGLSVRPIPEGFYRVIALSRVAVAEAGEVRDMVRDGTPPHAQVAAAAGALECARITRMVDHVCRIGGGTVRQAIGHLLLELRQRLDEVGLLDGSRAPMLLTQEVLAEALGVTSVQVNRVLGQFRRDGLVSIGSGWADMPDPDGLAVSIGLKPGG